MEGNLIHTIPGGLNSREECTIGGLFWLYNLCYTLRPIDKLV